MTVPVVIGIDPQKTRLGLALVEFEPPYRALWADTVSIDEADGGWRHEQIREALRRVESECDFLSAGPYWYEITRVGIEQVPYVGNPERFRELCEVVGIIQTRAHERWPWAPQIPLTQASWKKTALGNGAAKKPAVAEWAINTAPTGSLANVFAEQQDACDALGIAVAAAMVEIQERVA